MGERIGVVGGGIVGLAVARELARRRPDSTVVVFEKEPRVASHQTGHNSGVVHAGIYYQPGSLKARLCTRGRELLKEHCAEHGLPYEQVGKLVVAVDSCELARFDALEKTASENGVPGLSRVAATGIAEIEPHARGLAALHSPATAITDYVAVAQSYADDLRATGGAVRLRTEVTGVRRSVGGIDVLTSTGAARVDRLVLCGGAQADRLGRLAGGSREPRSCRSAANTCR